MKTKTFSFEFKIQDLYWVAFLMIMFAFLGYDAADFGLKLGEGFTNLFQFCAVVLGIFITIYDFVIIFLIFILNKMIKLNKR